MKNIISAPLDFPIILPTNIEKWNALWESEAAHIPKISVNHNYGQAHWHGVDVYVKDGIDAGQCTRYNAKNINCPELFKSLFDNLDSFPIDLEVMRIVSSKRTVTPHRDSKNPMLSVRSILFDNNPTSTFYYQFNNQKRYQTLPVETNSWIYWDQNSLHGSDFDPRYHKILVMYYGKPKTQLIDPAFNASKIKYDNFIIYN